MIVLEKALIFLYQIRAVLAGAWKSLHSISDPAPGAIQPPPYTCPSIASAALALALLLSLFVSLALSVCLSVSVSVSVSLSLSLSLSLFLSVYMYE